MMSFVLKFLGSKVLQSLLLKTAEILANKTDSNVDNEFVELVKEIVKGSN